MIRSGVNRHRDCIYTSYAKDRRYRRRAQMAAKTARTRGVQRKCTTLGPRNAPFCRDPGFQGDLALSSWSETEFEAVSGQGRQKLNVKKQRTLQVNSSRNCLAGRNAPSGVPHDSVLRFVCPLRRSFPPVMHPGTSVLTQQPQNNKSLAQDPNN